LSEIIIKLSKENTLLVKGPAIIKTNNNANILGVNIKDKVIKVRDNKFLPIESEEGSQLSILLEEDGKYYIKRREEVGVSIWGNIKDAVLFKEPRCIVIIGSNDSGKSTLSTYLANIINNVYIIDGDVGQGDLAPPGCIGSSYIRKKILDLTTIKADFYSFIGSIKPSDLVIDAIKELYTKTKYSTIINTDGYISDYGLIHKLRLIDIIKPDMIISLGDECLDILNKRYKNVYAAQKPRYVEKDYKVRLLNRLRRYRKFIGNNRRKFNIQSKRIWLFGNIYYPIIREDYLYLEPFGTIINLELLNDMYVGLSLNDNLVGFGIIRSPNILQSDYEGEFDTIMLSEIKLDDDILNEYKISIP
jgi:polynucleotide 5'-hydroxyl-kinase GRC3/NOL9